MLSHCCATPYVMYVHFPATNSSSLINHLYIRSFSSEYRQFLRRTQFLPSPILLALSLSESKLFGSACGQDYGGLSSEVMRDRTALRVSILLWRAGWISGGSASIFASGLG